MNTVLLLIILIPAIEIFLFIKIGSQIGAITTILLIFTTAIVGVYYAKYEGLNTLRSGFNQIRKNKTPTYEMMSGAAIAFAALLLIIPGFGTDLDTKLTTAESKMAEFMETFEKFQTVTSQTQASSKTQLDEVENQINSFKSSSEGQVESVMEDNDNLKVC